MFTASSTKSVRCALSQSEKDRTGVARIDRAITLPNEVRHAKPYIDYPTNLTQPKVSSNLPVWMPVKVSYNCWVILPTRPPLNCSVSPL